MSKRFGGVLALDDVSIVIERGTVHGLVGENGAGKSTLGKIVVGEYRPDRGTFLLDGEGADLSSPRAALERGVTYVAQELMLVPARSVLDNVVLGRERTRFGLLRERDARACYDRAATRLGFELDPGTPAGTLSVADQQKVELMRAIARDARLIVMDEPTAALTPDETDRLLGLVRRLADEGTTIVFVSHFLREVLAVCDRITVLKDGRVVETVAPPETDADRLVVSMIGRPLEGSFPVKQPPSADAPVAFAGRGIEVRRGEILGLAGLVGSGRTGLCRALFGLEPAGTDVVVDGEPLRLRSPRDAIRAGIAMLPESRRDQGLVMRRSIRDNVTLPHLDRFSTAGFVRQGSERAAVATALADVGVTEARNQGNVANLSGGNQQKVLFAKWLVREPRVFIADEPTRGVDVGAKRSIYELLAGLAARGAAVVLVSSEIEEVLGLAHRIVVMRHGALAGELAGHGVTKEDVMRIAFGSGEVAA